MHQSAEHAGLQNREQGEKRTIGLDLERDGMREVSFREQRLQLRDLVGTPEVVVGLVADDVASRRLERRVTVELTMT
jgi:hypothetical protein